jgi:hypothetical protein
VAIQNVGVLRFIGNQAGQSGRYHGLNLAFATQYNHRYLIFRVLKQIMIDHGYFKPACRCRLYALPSRLSVDCGTSILFKLVVRIETVVAWLLRRAMAACQPVFVKQTQPNRRLCIIQLSAW